jgi:predicted nucleotidyltransferase
MEQENLRDTPSAAARQSIKRPRYGSLPMAYNTADQVASGAAIEMARRLVAYWQRALGPELLGVYLIGSLAHGGFNRRYSDVDMAVVAEAGLSPRLLDQARGEAVALSAEWGPKLSVFWADRHFSVGRFPPLDRIDYLDRPVVLLERERVQPARPALEDIRHYLRGAPFANWADRARQLTAAAHLEPKDRKAYLRALLYPARFCLSYLTGRMGSNDDGVAFLREQRLPGLDLASIESALQCRHAAADPDPLFAGRHVLSAQIEACAALFAA